MPTAVQGREAVAQIVRALQLADRQGFDALILARGGGSLEDLWCFNEEAVARAVAACTTPIVSAVGHETDVSISDFVADVRAPTPSAAAELLAPNAGDLQQRLDGLRRRLVLRMRDQLLRERLRLEGVAAACAIPANACASRHSAWTTWICACAVPSSASWRSATNAWSAWNASRRTASGPHPGAAPAEARQPRRALPRAAREALRDRRQRLEGLAQTLNVVSPLATLGRGYSILLDERGRAIRDAGQTQPGQRLKAPREGELEVRVEDNHRTPVTLSLLD